MKILPKECIPKCRYVIIEKTYNYPKIDGRLKQVWDGRGYVVYTSHRDGSHLYTSTILPIEKCIAMAKRRIKKLRRLNII